MTVVLHPLTDDRRRLCHRPHGRGAGGARLGFMLVASYNPGYQTILKKLKPSTRQRFVSIGFDFPDPATETAVVVAETGLDAGPCRSRWSASPGTSAGSRAWIWRRASRRASSSMPAR